MSKKITCQLSAKSLGQAMREIEQYKREMGRKTQELRKRVAEWIADNARSGFAGAIADDLTGMSGGSRGANVSVDAADDGKIALVIAGGQDAIFIEFGAGVYHNGAAGSSPHPKGGELGFTIGSYGKGLGSKSVWGFYEDGNLRLTHGTPASMPMYNALREACGSVAQIAREVFGT